LPTSKTAPYAPEPLDVTVRDGKPAMLRIKRRRVPVKEILNVWRIDEEWWRKAISRLYFLLEVESGARVTVFHDLESGEWYRQNWA
jgi:hypothetical protein